MKSFIALIVISSLAISLCQNTLPSTFTMAGCAFVAGGSVLTNQCTQCNSGFVLTNQTTSCASPNSCVAGCSVCLNTGVCFAGGCMTNWVMNTNTNLCVSCTGATGPTATGATAGCRTCTLSSTSTATLNVVACTACSNFDGTWNYNPTPTSNGNCISCDNPASQVWSSTVNIKGVASCQNCTIAAVTASVTATAITAPSYVTCTKCYAAFGMFPIAAVIATQVATAQVVAQQPVSTLTAVFTSTPVCMSLGSAQPTTTTGAQDAWGNSFQSVATTGQVTGTNCRGGLYYNYIAADNALPTWFVHCTEGLAGYYAALAGAVYVAPGSGVGLYPTIAPVAGTNTWIFMQKGTAGTASGNPATNAFLPAANMGNINSASTCSFGFFTHTPAVATWVITGTAYAGATGLASYCTGCASTATLVGQVCITNVTGCVLGQTLTTTTCGIAAAGYYLVSSVPTLCTNLVVCTGGCLGTQYMASNGSCITATPITGCGVQNSTTFCVQCSGFYTNVPNCTACSTGCSVCTSGTVCTNCSTGFTLSSAAACVSTAATTGKSANALLSGLAFISMIFYYIF